MRVEESGQHTSTDDDNVPGLPPEPSKPPDGPARRENGPPSTQLEGEWNIAASCDVGHTSGHTDVVIFLS